MRRLLHGPGRLFLLFALLAILALWNGRKEGSGRLIDAGNRRVILADGDSLKIGDETIRLAGIDAPERGQFCQDAHGGSWSCGVSAMAALEAIIARGALRCDGLEHDRYGRLVARCSVKGQSDIGAEMVAQGWAINLSDHVTGHYAAQESAAHAAKKGIWAGSFEKPWQWREKHGVRTKTVR